MTHRYNTPSSVLHWLVAALILTAFPLGVYMHGLPLSPRKLQLFSYHKWLGVTVLMLAGVRLVWRLAKGAPQPVAGPAWQQKAASVTHVLLYVLMFAVPFSGWLMSSAKGFPVVYLGVLPLPDLVGKDATLGDLLQTVHQALNVGLLSLVGLHVAAGLKHQFIDRDGTIGRMLPLSFLTNAK